MNTAHTIDAKQKKQGELFFFALFIPWIALTILSETTVSYLFSDVADYIVGLLKSTILPVCLLLVNLFLFNKTSTIKKLLALCVVVLLTSQCFLVTYHDDLLLCACLVIASANIDFKKILKVYLLVSLVLAAATTVSAVTGLIQNIALHNSYVPRYALGCFWCTDYSGRAFYLILAVLYLYSRRMKILHWISLLAVSLLVFRFTFGKMDFACTLLAIICFFIHETLEKKKENNDPETGRWNRFWSITAPVITPVAAAVMTVLTLLYSTENAFILKLNTILTRRLEWGYQGFSKIGITLCGQYVKWIGMGGISDDTLPEDYNFVDCSYHQILFSFGIIIAIAVIILHCYLAYKNLRDTRFLMVVTFIALNCVIAHHLLDPAYNPFWAAMLAAMPVSAKAPIAEPSPDGISCPMTYGQKFIKRLIDITVSIPGILISVLLLIIFAPIIFIQSPGRVLFRQKRAGKNGKVFTFYKLRTMCPDADAKKASLMDQNKMKGPMFKIDNDPRTIPVGRFLRKTHLDEFPQFLNVLKGDMSLVGTRPPTLDEYEQYTPYHMTRLAMKPGITGLWQISWRSDITDFEDVVRLDRQYIENFSVSEDLRIIGKTIRLILSAPFHG